MPEEWETFDVDREGIETILNFLKGLKTEWARSIAQTLSAEAIQKSMKFWAIDTKPAGTGYASANVVYQSVPFMATGDDLCKQMPSAYRQMGVTLLDTRCNFKINNLDAVRFKIQLQMGALAVTEYQYIYLQSRSIWILTLAVDSTQWSKYQSTFEDIAETFRVVR